MQFRCASRIEPLRLGFAHAVHSLISAHEYTFCTHVRKTWLDSVLVDGACSARLITVVCEVKDGFILSVL